MDELLAKYFAEEASEDERLVVEKWRSESSENSKEFFTAKDAWLGIEKIEVDVTAKDILKTRSIGPNAVGWLKYVAAALVIVVAGVLGYINFFGNNEANPSGPLANIEVLPDGSSISLYKDASYEIVDMDNLRSINVTGKVFLDVKHNESKPFIVFTDKAKIEVLGTSFLVDTETNETTEVMVESGVVKLSQSAAYKADFTSLELRKGEMGFINPKSKSLLKQKIKDLNFLSWNTRVITFNNDELKEVARVLEDVYGIEVQFEDEDLANCRLSAKYKEKTAEEVIKIISETFSIHYRKANDRVVFSGKGC